MPDKVAPLRSRLTALRIRLADSWERLMAIRSKDQEVVRLGRLFNVLMVTSLGIVAALSSIFLLLPPLGYTSPLVSWMAAAFPLAFLPIAIFCIAMSRRGHVRSMVLFYVWFNLLAITLAVYLFDGVYSPGWVLYIWTITIAGTLLTPAYSLGFTEGVLGYSLILFLLTHFGVYTPPLTFGIAREFLDIAFTLVIQAFTVGLLTYLNMRSLREALRHLRESEALYRGVFDNAADAIFTIDKDTNLMSLNPAFSKLTGWCVEDWLGKSFIPLALPKELPIAYGVLEKTLQGQAVERFELHALKKSGDYFTGEFTVAPLTQGNEVILLGICRDVTERKHMEEALRESEQRFHIIFDTAPDGIFKLSMEGRFTSANPAVEHLVGRTSEDLLGNSFTEWIHPDDLPLANQTFMDIMNGQTEKVEVRVCAKAGGYRIIAVNATPQFERGRLAGVLGFFRDMTERKQMEEEIKTLNEELECKVQERTQQLLEAQEELIRKEKLSMLGQVAGSVGHELRTPLGVTSNAIYFLKMVLTEADETTREYLDIIGSEITEADRIVSDLLDSVRTKPPQTQLVDIESLINQTLFKCTVPPSVELRLDFSSKSFPHPGGPDAGSASLPQPDHQWHRRHASGGRFGNLR